MKKTIPLSMLLLAGCSAVPSTENSSSAINTFYDYQIYASGKSKALHDLVEELSSADVVLVGEWHGHSATHRFQTDLLAALNQSGLPTALAMEQFSRDVQPVVDDYLSGEIGEQTLIKQGNAWPNYTSDYRPLVEFARTNNLDVIAANAPKNTVKCIGRKGLSWTEHLSEEDRGFIAKNIDTSDSPYKQKFMASMHHGKPEQTANQYAAQVTWDETMAESIVQYLGENQGKKVLLTAGKFHVTGGLGTAHSIKRQNPDLNVVVIDPVTEISESAIGYQVLVAELPPRYIKQENRMKAYHQLGKRNAGLNCDIK
ncbi:putative Ferric uptake regulator, CjrA [Vibrio nigripulchritudo SOn1]|uniref:Ferric uptake regulator, CjrA n=1 Tax=Vibrio nigripulchritudo SOn1 TaxID=1238450 RepID=A0AAV2VJ10_9VIBR|nr:ChaN family lipoprotein [Vibrio nigripulchritudo]CCO44389.1 putative Ferric uptake regulator, CjrA [Vibrio nigripulchritudo SOn1]